MNSNNKDQQLFESLRNAPTEISLERVEAIIKDLPTMPSSPQVENDWTNFLNFKNLIMMSIPISIAIGLFIVNSNNDKIQQSTYVEDLPNKIVLSTQEEQTLAKIELEPIAALPAVKKQLVPTEQKEDVKIEPATVTSSSNDVTVPLANLKSSNNESNIQQKKNQTTVSKPKTERVKITPPVVQEVIDNLPNFTNPELRKLKRTLYRNLKQDGLIFSKSEFVEIKLLGNEILVNDVAVNSEQFIRYTALTRKVGNGPNRRIQIDPKFIKVGDFTEKGFKGEGLGTFRETYDRESTSWDLEQKSLDTFADDLLRNKLESGSSDGLFSYNIQYEKAKILHEELYNMLLNDRLIKTRQDFVLVELPKGIILINDTELKSELFSKYDKLFSENKIKHGEHRQLRLSERTIRIGDFSKGNFSGTSIELRD